MHWRHEQLSLQMLLATFQHHSAPRGQMTARSGEGVRGEVYGQVPGAPPPQAAGTQYFAMDVDEVPAAGGSRPDRLAPVSGPQERVQRHFVKQLVEPVRGVPVLDAPVPKMVDHLVDVLKIFDRSLTEQVVEVPKVTLQDVVPQRAVLRVPQLAEQLVDVPVPESVILAHGRCDLGVKWCQIATQGGRCYWWMAGTRHVQWRRPEGFTASPRRYANTGQG